MFCILEWLSPLDTRSASQGHAGFPSRPGEFPHLIRRVVTASDPQSREKRREDALSHRAARHLEEATAPMKATGSPCVIGGVATM